MTEVPSNLYYTSHQIPKLKCFSCPLVVVFAQSIEARCNQICIDRSQLHVRVLTNGTCFVISIKFSGWALEQSLSMQTTSTLLKGQVLVFNIRAWNLSLCDMIEMEYTHNLSRNRVWTASLLQYVCPLNKLSTLKIISTPFKQDFINTRHLY